ncbi:MAG: hypothetical protein JNL67_07715 [Planctomycetaceae bacterium]|nr:hypothetical protein [Planctomycetaceae bacterium]
MGQIGDVWRVYKRGGGTNAGPDGAVHGGGRWTDGAVHGGGRWTDGAVHDISWTDGAVHDTGSWTDGAVHDTGSWTGGAVHDTRHELERIQKLIYSTYLYGYRLR